MGGVFLEGVRPDSLSRRYTFLLLRVATRLSRGGRVGSYVVRWAWSPTIRASFEAAAAEQQCLIGMLVRGGRRHHEPRYGAVSVCVDGTAPAGGWIRRRRRRATGRQRAGKRRIELSLNKNFCLQISTASCVEHFVFLGRWRRKTDWN